ncbi:hypothetical protein D3C79_857010 [compost metagenome]
MAPSPAKARPRPAAECSLIWKPEAKLLLANSARVLARARLLNNVVMGILVLVPTAGRALGIDIIAPAWAGVARP